MCNSNGNIENGDYITSSDYLSYGIPQDDDILHNYTVSKATISCDFILNSPVWMHGSARRAWYSSHSD